jgi:hypothetical protein
MSDHPIDFDWAIYPYEGSELPDGTPLPHTAFYSDGIVEDWSGRRCSCNGVGCLNCGGTGDLHEPTWRWEE